MNNSTGQYNDDTIKITAIHTNLNQEIIKITEDKLKIVLNNHSLNIEQKKAWMTPLSILVTIVLTFVTAEFKKAYFPAATWQAFFIMFAAITMIWLISAIILACKTKSIPNIIDEIKNQSTEIKQNQ
jgi:hypothetical protein